MTVTTACVIFIANAMQSESEVCDTKLYNYRTEQSASERAFGSFTADVFHLYIENACIALLK
jgi:hypothetical protein